MGLIKKVNRDDFFEKMSDEEKEKFSTIEKELKPHTELVIIGSDTFEIVSFDIATNILFSKLQKEYREIIKDKPGTTFNDLIQGENNIIKRILDFLEIDVDIQTITYKQFKYLMWVIAKNYVFTEIAESSYVNQLTPFFFI